MKELQEICKKKNHSLVKLTGKVVSSGKKEKTKEEKKKAEEMQLVMKGRITRRLSEAPHQPLLLCADALQGGDGWESDRIGRRSVRRSGRE